MEIRFNTDLINSDFAPIKPGKHSLFGNGALPNNVDVFFKAKWHELFARYESARAFLFQTSDGGNYNSWGIEKLEEREKKYCELMIKSQLYEASLCFYNMVIDLSWTLTYVCAEYVVYDSGKSESINDILPIEKTFDMLRKLERNVVSPTAEESPFRYLKVMNPTFEPAIKIIEDFWLEISTSEIRNNYNFIKHKGAPLYKEINEYVNFPRVFSFVKEVDGKQIECPTDIRDVTKELELDKEVQKLLDFDNDKLFPYIDSLIKELTKIIRPSEMII